MKQHTIQVTVLLEKSLWVGIFERGDKEDYAVARAIFGNEPTDSELYAFVSTNFKDLRFTEAQGFTLRIKRKNPKRVLREVKNKMAKAKCTSSTETHAQEVLRLELEKNKKTKKTISRVQREAKKEKIFSLKQEKKKQKHRGH